MQEADAGGQAVRHIVIQPLHLYSVHVPAQCSLYTVQEVETNSETYTPIMSWSQIMHFVFAALKDVTTVRLWVAFPALPLLMRPFSLQFLVHPCLLYIHSAPL